MSIDPLFLAIKMRSGSEEEKDQAGRILPLVKQHHRLLVTLLLLNSLANEALPIFLEPLVSPLVAVLLSVTFVLFFGEIIPSAVFTGPEQMKIAAKLVPLVRAVMIFFTPAAWPIAKALDYFLGHEHDDDGEGAITEFNRDELTALMKIQYEKSLRTSNETSFRLPNVEAGMPILVEHNAEESANSPIPSPRLDLIERTPLLSSDHEYRKSVPDLNGYELSKISQNKEERYHANEVFIVEGAFNLTKKTVADIYLPMEKVFTIDADAIMDIETLAYIYASGRSRIPVVKKRFMTPLSPLSNNSTRSLRHVRKKSTDWISKVFGTSPAESIPDEEAPSEMVIDVCGILMARHLIVTNPDDNRPLSSMPTVKPLLVTPDCSLLFMLKLFLKSRFHMALVVQNPKVANLCLNLGKPITHETAGVLGILTMEDVLEEILQEKIYDEADETGSHGHFPRTACSPASKKRMDRESNIRSMSRAVDLHPTSPVKAVLESIEEGTDNLSKSLKTHDE